MKLKLLILFILILNSSLFANHPVELWVHIENKVWPHNASCDTVTLNVLAGGDGGNYISSSELAQWHNVDNIKYGSRIHRSVYTKTISCTSFDKKIYEKWYKFTFTVDSCLNYTIFNPETNLCEAPPPECEPIPNSQEIAYTEEECNFEHIISIYPEEGAPNYIEHIFWSLCHDSCWAEVHSCPTGQLAFKNKCEKPEDYLKCSGNLECNIMGFGVSGSEECFKTCFCDGEEVFNGVVSCDERPVMPDTNTTNPPPPPNPDNNSTTPPDDNNSTTPPDDNNSTTPPDDNGYGGGSGGDDGGGIDNGENNSTNGSGGHTGDNNSTTPPDDYGNGGGGSGGDDNNNSSGVIDGSDLVESDFTELLSDAETYYEKWKNEFITFSNNVDEQLNNIKSQYDNARSIFDSERSFSVPVGQTSNCLSFNFHGKSIDLDLCYSFSLLSPIVYFVTTLGFMIATFRFFVNHLLKGFE